MANILEQVLEQGHTSDSAKDWAIRWLAQLEDSIEAGQPLELSPDDVAMVRHIIQYP